MHSSRMRTSRLLTASHSIRCGGVHGRGGHVWQGEHVWQGRVCSMHALPPWTEFLTHACENITFQQLRCRRL